MDQLKWGTWLICLCTGTRTILIIIYFLFVFFFFVLVKDSLPTWGMSDCWLCGGFFGKRQHESRIVWNRLKSFECRPYWMLHKIIMDATLGSATTLSIKRRDSWSLPQMTSMCRAGDEDERARWREEQKKTTLSLLVSSVFTVTTQCCCRFIQERKN